MTQSPTSEQPSPSGNEIEHPRTVFADFSDVATGRSFVTQLQAKIPVGVFSINSPVAGGGCRTAVQIEGSQVEVANALAISLGGKLGAIATPRRTAPRPAEKPAGAEGEQPDMPAKKSTKGKKSTKKEVKKGASPRFGKKTECAAPGHGEYGDIDAHNTKHHGGKPFVAAAKGK